MTLLPHVLPTGTKTARTRASHLRLALGACAAAAVFLGLSAGCGGSGNANGQAHIRSLDLCSNGGTATIFINNGSTNGTQNFEQASGYLFLNGGTSTFTFTLDATSGILYPSINSSLTGGDYYTAFLLGNVNVPNVAQTGYPLLTVEQDDRTTPQSGDARIRIVDAAPDSPALSNTALTSSAVDVYVGTQKVAQNFVYGTIGVIDTSTSNMLPPAGGPTNTYVDVPAGSTTIAVDGGGTKTSILPAATVPVTLTAGHLYTLSIVETTFYQAAVVGPPATPVIKAVYATNLTDDGT